MPWPTSQGITGNEDGDNLGVDWVLQWNFGSNEKHHAIAEYRTLIEDLQHAGLRVQVRRGDNTTLLVFIHVPRDHLGRMIRKSRLQDWLCGITHTFPADDGNTIAADTAAEEIRSVFDAVTGSRSKGGAGIESTYSGWRNITNSFPLHDPDAYSRILQRWRRKFVWTVKDLDTIRTTFGEKVALYCAFLHCYFFFLSVPAILGFATWLNLGAFSITYGSLLSLWSIVFVEYWKIREADLSLRWGVKGLQQLKENRADNPKERHPRSSGTVGAILPGKQVLTQMLLALFALIASVVVGSSVCPTLAGEALLFGQPVQQYVWLLPTILFSLLQPLAADLLSWAAAWLLSYDNHRSQASYGFVLFPRTVLLEFITSLLPTIVSAYVYLPFNKPNIPFLVMLTHSGLDLDQPRGHGEFDMNILRLQTTVLFFSRPVQAPNIWKRTIWPFTKREVRHTYLPRGVDSDSQATRVSQINSSNEEVFLRRVCNEAEAEEYDVDNNILRKAVQYGYMIMFSVISPAVPLVMFFSAWLELRGLFSNLTKNYQRPPPARAESIGPYLQALEVLSQMGTISTAVVIQLVRNPPTNIDLLSLLLTMLIAHQLHLAARLAVSAMLQKLLIDPLTQESTLLYNARKKFLETTLYHSSPGSPGTRARRRVRFNERVNVYNSSVTPSSSSDSGSPSPDSEQPHDEVLKGSDRESEFWNWGSGDPSADGVELIKTFGGSEDTIRRKVMKATMIF